MIVPVGSTNIIIKKKIDNLTDYVSENTFCMPHLVPFANMSFNCILPGSRFHIWPPYKERDSYIKVIWHRLPFDQTKLSDVVTVVCCIDDVRVVQLSCVH